MKKNKFKTSIIFICLTGLFLPRIGAQDLPANFNMEFLSSLPQSMQRDLMQSQETSDDTQETLNANPNTRLDSIEKGIDDVRSKIEMLEYRASLSKNKTNDLVVFGSNFFNSFQTTFSPINEQNISSEYILDVGDVLFVQLVSSEINSKSKLKINRDGSIFIPRIGSTVIAGLNFQDAIRNISAFVNSQKLGVEAFISMEALRDIKVLIIGGGNNKNGIYTLPGGSNILSLLHAAGGIGENNSYREIVHKRDGIVIDRVDLYELFIDGKFNLSKSLRSGDTLLLTPIKKQVSITGGVAQTGIFELKENENFSHLIKFARNFKYYNDSQISVFRPDGSSLRFNDQIPDNFSLNDGDFIYVPSYVPTSREYFEISISGAVKKPGRYTFEPYTKLSEILNKAGGYSQNAYPFGGKIFRESVTKVHQEIVRRSYNELITYLASSGTAATSVINSGNFNSLLTELKNATPQGRLAAEFNLQTLKAQPDEDIILAPGDIIEIPYFSSEVMVFGEVQNPGGQLLELNQSIKTI